MITQPNTERWLPIPGWEGLYEVSNLGQVRSLKRRKGTQGNLILKTPPDNRGYPQLNLCRGGIVKHTFVHYLVAQAFHGPRPPGMECRHLDGHKTNNRANNLAWGTPGENNEDRVRHGTWTNKFVNATHCKYGHEYTEENTRWAINKKGSTHRLCRACKRRRNREQTARRKATRAARPGGVRPWNRG